MIINIPMMPQMANSACFFRKNAPSANFLVAKIQLALYTMHIPMMTKNMGTKMRMLWMTSLLCMGKKLKFFF
jgi:hypothetical protein